MQRSSPAPPRSKPVKRTSPPVLIPCSCPPHKTLAQSERRSSCTLPSAFPPPPQTEYSNISIPSAVAGPSPETSAPPVQTKTKTSSQSGSRPANLPSSAIPAPATASSGPTDTPLQTSAPPPPSPASQRDTSSSTPDIANPPKTPCQSPPATAPPASGCAKRRLVGSQSPNSSQDFVPTLAPPWHHSSLQQFDVAFRPCSEPLHSEICLTLFLSPPLRNSTKPLLAVRSAATVIPKTGASPSNWAVIPNPPYLGG